MYSHKEGKLSWFLLPCQVLCRKLTRVKQTGVLMLAMCVPGGDAQWQIKKERSGLWLIEWLSMGQSMKVGQKQREDFRFPSVEAVGRDVFVEYCASSFHQLDISWGVISERMTLLGSCTQWWWMREGSGPWGQHQPWTGGPGLYEKTGTESWRASQEAAFSFPWSDSLSQQ